MLAGEPERIGRGPGGLRDPAVGVVAVGVGLGAAAVGEGDHRAEGVGERVAPVGAGGAAQPGELAGGLADHAS